MERESTGQSDHQSAPAVISTTLSQRCTIQGPISNFSLIMILISLNFIRKNPSSFCFVQIYGVRISQHNDVVNHVPLLCLLTYKGKKSVSIDASSLGTTEVGGVATIGPSGTM